MRNNRIPKKVKRSKKIPVKAILSDEPLSHDGEYPVFSFKFCSDNHCLLSEWDGEEIAELIRTFKKMESLTWTGVFKHGGLRYKYIDNYSKPLPLMVSKDETIGEIRVSKQSRIFGFRNRNVFHIIWFDNKHEICPETRRA
ncbi:MAG: hypothetical protein A4E56_03239 [Pelotomaculum sp. PtaU1.Bin065]|nr:MAG: hypothetical protein A4E56_03239 [Pelotomaculum sp. PtaU1.Bin065]